MNFDRDDVRQDQATVQRAADILNGGGLVVFPTETVYGIAASVVSDAGCAALRKFKGRGDDQPFTIHLPDPGSVERYVDLSNPRLRRVVEKLMPGPVTLVMEVDDETIHRKMDELGLGRDLAGRLYHENTVGLRCPDLGLSRGVLGGIDGPVIASSANRHGHPPPYDAPSAAEAVGDAADLVIDGGRCRFAKPSTIVRVRAGDGGDPRVSVERVGVYDERLIRKRLRWTIVFVCTGNTCRSPMAEGYAKSLLTRPRGGGTEFPESIEGNRENPGAVELPGGFPGEVPGEFREEVRMISAGVSTVPGLVASEGAVEALRLGGIDLGRHRSTPLTLEMIHEADVIYCMTHQHQRAVLGMAPFAGDRVQLLDPSVDIDDPFGGDVETYQRCAELIRGRVEQRLTELDLFR